MNSPKVRSCPECKEGTMIERTGKDGKFLACNKYPSCKTTRPLPPEPKLPSNQRMIVRQSSLKAAIELVGKGVEKNDVLKVAEQFEEWVMRDE